MQPNNPLTYFNIISVLVCYVYARLKRWVFNLDLNIDYVYMDISNQIIYLILIKTILRLRCLHELLLE